MTSIRPVILSGGSGTRLWPLSQPELPKQFVPLFEGRSLFALTMDRVSDIGGRDGPIVVTGIGHLGLVETEIVDLTPEPLVIVEPVGRNTTAAIVAAALTAEPDDVLVILPSDHLISDVGDFREAVLRAASLASDGDIVTFGIKPTRPETGYGYIEVGDPVDGGFAVERFKEKPGREDAQRMANDGAHLWNSGMFIVRSDRVIEEVGRTRPELVDEVSSALPEAAGGGVVPLGDAFSDVESISFDYSVMEQTDRAVVVPLDTGWDDVGSYPSLLAASPTDAHGNHLSGDVKVDDVTSSYIVAKTRRVVVAGLNEVVVIETPDEVLVMALDRSQDVGTLRERDDAD